MCFNHDESVVALTVADQYILLDTSRECQLIRHLPRNSQSPGQTLSFCPEGGYLVKTASTGNNQVEVLECSKYKQLASQPMQERVQAVQCIANGQILVQLAKRIKIFQLATSQLIQLHDFNLCQSISAFSISTNQRYLGVLLTECPLLKVVDRESNEWHQQVTYGSAVHQVVMGDSSEVITAGGVEGLFLWGITGYNSDEYQHAFTN